MLVFPSQGSLRRPSFVGLEDPFGRDGGDGYPDRRRGGGQARRRPGGGREAAVRGGAAGCLQPKRAEGERGAARRLN